MQSLPKITTENCLFDCKDIKGPSRCNVFFDKAQKSYVLKISQTQGFTYNHTNHVAVKGNSVQIQIYLNEKLKLTMELVHLGQQFRIVVSSTCQAIYQKKPDEVIISSAFILTKRWISLCFDVDSFFPNGDYCLQQLQITSQCRIRKVYECLHPLLIKYSLILISDGLCVVQRINEKRINELMPMTLRTQSESKQLRKISVVRRQSTLISQDPSKDSERRSVPINNQKNKVKQIQSKKLPLQGLNELYSIPNNQQSMRPQRQKPQHEMLLEKTIKLATGLQIIEEVQQKKPPTHPMAFKQLIQNEHLKKNAVKSFLRHTQQEFKNQSQMTIETVEDIRNEPEHDSDKLSQFSQNDKDEYQTKYGKFSSSFAKPLGFSSMNYKLVSQQSTNQQQSSQEYFYLSSQQMDKQADRSVNENEIEELIDVIENKSRISEDSLNSINALNIKQEDSSEELAVSKFE